MKKINVALLHKVIPIIKHSWLTIALLILVIVSSCYNVSLSSTIKKQKRTISTLKGDIDNLESQVDDLQNEVYDLEDYKNAMESFLNRDNDIILPLDTTLLNIK